MDYNTEIWLRLQMAKTLKHPDLASYLENFLVENSFEVSAKPAMVEINYKAAVT